MRKKRLLLLAAVALVFCVIAVLLLRPSPVVISPSVPITLRYINWTNGSVGRADEPTFWVTNHTDKSLHITLRTVEIQTNQAWTTYSQISGPGLLYFTTKQSREGLLPPHAAGFGSMLAQRVILPTNVIWRVRASVAEKLVGGEEVVAAVAHEPRLLEARLLTSNTNIPINPFRQDVSQFGHSSPVVSEVVAPP